MSWTEVVVGGREKELAAVKIKAEDVSLIMTELEVNKRTAERRLREYQGNIVAALESLISL